MKDNRTATCPFNTTKGQETHGVRHAVPALVRGAEDGGGVEARVDAGGELARAVEGAFPEVQVTPPRVLPVAVHVDDQIHPALLPSDWMNGVVKMHFQAASTLPETASFK